MLEFKTIEEPAPNNEILDIIKNYEYTTQNGLVKVLINTNLKFIEPTKYLITKPITLTILEYKVNEISNKPFYIKEYKKDNEYIYSNLVFSFKFDSLNKKTKRELINRILSK